MKSQPAYGKEFLPYMADEPGFKWIR